MRQQTAALAVAVVAAAVIPYLPLYGADYVQDDHVAVESNPIVARGDVREIFSTSYWAGAQGDDRSLYRPLTILTFALERRLAGAPDPGLSHAINVALHGAASLLLFLLLRRLGASTAVSVSAALLFGVHPVHVEAVAGAVGRAEVLAAAATLGAVLALSAGGRRGAWGCAGLLFVALTSKEIGLAAIPLLVLHEILLRRREPGGFGSWAVDRATSLAPAALATVVYLWLRTEALEAFLSVQTIHPADNVVVRLEGIPRVATALSLVMHNARLLFFPATLSADYSGNALPAAAGLTDPLVLGGAALLVATALLATVPAAAALFRGRGERVARVALPSFAAALALAPYLVIGNLLVPIGAGIAERVLYLPSAGVCAGAALAIAGASRGRSRVALAVVGALVLAGGARTAVRAAQWTDDASVFGAAARDVPLAQRPHYVLAKLAERRGDPDEALERFDRTLEVWPDHVLALFEKGVVLANRGRLDEAEALFRETLRRNPAHAAAYLNLGLVLQREGSVSAAEREFRKAVIHDAELDKAWASLGHLRFAKGAFAGAAEAYGRAVALGRADLTGRLLEARRRAGAGPGAVSRP